MSLAEIRAYNAGVRATLAMAKHTADALAMRSLRPIHDGFAVEALDAFAEAGAALLLPEPIGRARIAGSSPHAG